ncbi:hypothetical protein [Polaribacter porphyrae]|nr:hypothetical protein [Polaribacter porphyrae]
MKIKDNNNTEKRNQSSGEIFQAKRNTWNSRRKYNYKYVTTVF